MSNVAYLYCYIKLEKCKILKFRHRLNNYNFLTQYSLLKGINLKNIFQVMFDIFDTNGFKQTIGTLIIYKNLGYYRVSIPALIFNLIVAVVQTNFK